MKKVLRNVFSLLLCSALVLPLLAENSSFTKVGVAKVDITGPITDISTGYNSMGDLMEGLLTRLYARAFVIDDGDEPFVFVSAELVHMTESIKPGVLAKLKADGYWFFKEENTMMAATHCHSSTSNTSWFALYDLVNGVSGYDDESYKIIVKGIAEAIEQAYDSRVPGSASLVYADTDIKAYNRSADAFLTNIDAADYGYEINADGTFSYETGLAAAKNAYNHEMAGIVLTDSNGKDIGFYNFFASHGTSNGITNRFVASDHKGFAATEVEKKMGKGFVAAFAQADSGDTSPNAVNEEDYHAAFLRPVEEDPSIDVIENQMVYGKMEADAAMKLLTEQTRIPLSGKLCFNYTAVDFSTVDVDLSYVGDYHMPYDDLSAGFVSTCEPCIGAGIIAGDEEGAPVDNAEEGSVKHQFVKNSTGGYDRIKYDFSTIDLNGLENLMGPLWPTAMAIIKSDKYDEQQVEKVVCLAVGGLMQKAQPLQVVQFGEVAIAGVPFELTYVQADRIRKVLTQTLAQAGVTKVIIATHANAYSQYVTTREEFAAQHYEGSTCLFGPWSGAALTQELDKLCAGIVAGEKSDIGAPLQETEPSGLLYTKMAAVDPSSDIGIYCTLEKDCEKTVYSEGEWVSAVFTGANTRHVVNLRLADSSSVPADYSFFEIQKLENGEWTTYLTDDDPYTTFHVHRAAIGFDITCSWLIKGETYEPGVYRIVYNGIAKELKWFKNYFNLIPAYSSTFIVE